MNVSTTVAEMEAARDTMAGIVGLVPTMGYLHEGHLSLVRRARADCDHVIASIFVNPTQFGANEDLERYPRDADRDLRLLEAELVDAVFMPPVDEIYPPGFHDWVEVGGPLTERLEGAARPGHFRGVTTVVARLFRIIRPHKAYFGQKDAQQLRAIRRMVRDLALEVEIVAMPTVRDPDGVAMSSRNAYLSPNEREAALAIPRALEIARRMVMEDGLRDADVIRQAVRIFVETPQNDPSPKRDVSLHRGISVQQGGSSRRGVSSPRVDLEYVSISDEDTFEELDTIDRPALVLLAARVGETRLIDNVVVVPKGARVPGRPRSIV